MLLNFKLSNTLSQNSCCFATTLSFSWHEMFQSFYLRSLQLIWLVQMEFQECDAKESLDSPSQTLKKECTIQTPRFVVVLIRRLQWSAPMQYLQCLQFKNSELQEKSHSWSPAISSQCNFNAPACKLTIQVKLFKSVTPVCSRHYYVNFRPPLHTWSTRLQTGHLL